MTGRSFVAVCWMIFSIYWIISATSVKATSERQHMAGGALHLALLLLAALLMAASWLGWPANSAPAAPSLVADTLGDLLCVLGLAWAIWARRTLAGNWSSSVAFKLGHELVVHGPYKYVRHPIYAGILLMVLGSAVAIGRAEAFIAAFAFVGSFWLKLRQEEALMMRHFPEGYPAYKRQVKALVPFMW